ncbi:MAG TPA: SGNH/GDSL hydrolase family protein [Gemmatimonadales bacterium]|nr:SGNH/GDSL hydrolase family protein [Gemmatimonadales bacterium]
MNELRLAWALLVALTGLAVLPGESGLSVFAVCLALSTPGWLVMLRGPAAAAAREQAAELSRSPRARALAMVTAALVILLAPVFSVSAALSAATVLGSALLWSLHRRGAGRTLALLEKLTAIGGALVLVLFPLDAVLRLPPLARAYGLPGERQRQADRYDRLWERNIFNFRSPHADVRRRPGVRRIIVLGDSFTWGLLVPDSDSIWPSRLERALGGSTEVVNMAQRGWTTANEAEFLRRLGWQFDPDLLIVQFYLNDAYESRPGLHFEEGRRLYLLPLQFWQGYIRQSTLSSLVSQAVNGLLFGVLFRQKENEDRYDETSPGWTQMRAALREIGDSARGRGVPALLVLFPDLTPGEWTAETYPSRGIHDRVAAAARAAGLEAFDLTAAFAAEGGDWKRWWASPYDAHPNEAAHAVAAAAIASHLRRYPALAGSVASP